MKTPGEQFGFKKKNPNTANKTFYLLPFLFLLFPTLGMFFHKTLDSRQMSGGIFSCSFMATEKFCRDNVVKMVTTVYIQKDAHGLESYS